MTMAQLSWALRTRAPALTPRREESTMFSLLMKWMRDNKILPQISDTERQALEAGDVWIDGQFFAGKVDFKQILNEAYNKLPANEQAFLDGPCEELLKMADGYDIQRRRVVPQEIFDFLSKNGFSAMQIDRSEERRVGKAPRPLLPPRRCKQNDTE